MPNILIIDAQGGGMGKQLISGIRQRKIKAFVTAVGTNSAATSAMLAAGADAAATGENAVMVACRKSDIIAGPLGIVIADALLGEITPKMAEAVGTSPAERILIPVDRCGNVVAGLKKPAKMSELIDDALELIREASESAEKG